LETEADPVKMTELNTELATLSTAKETAQATSDELAASFAVVQEEMKLAQEIERAHKVEEAKNQAFKDGQEDLANILMYVADLNERKANADAEWVALMASDPASAPAAKERSEALAAALTAAGTMHASMTAFAAELDAAKTKEAAATTAKAGSVALKEAKEKLKNFEARATELTAEATETQAASDATQSQRKKADFATTLMNIQVEQIELGFIIDDIKAQITTMETTIAAEEATAGSADLTEFNTLTTSKTTIDATVATLETAANDLYAQAWELEQSDPAQYATLLAQADAYYADGSDLMTAYMTQADLVAQLAPLTERKAARDGAATEEAAAAAAKTAAEAFITEFEAKQTATEALRG
jgi:hypothetical protein